MLLSLPVLQTSKSLICIFVLAGQCVAAFDHFCPLLATAVGDCNRARFWCVHPSPLPDQVHVLARL